MELEGDDASLLPQRQRPSLNYLSETIDYLSALQNRHSGPIGGQARHLKPCQLAFGLVESAPKTVKTLQLLIDMGSHLGRCRQFDLLALVKERGHSSAL